MSRAGRLVVVSITAVSTGMAGHVYGTIRENNQALREASVVLRCGDESTPGTTDHEGMYRIYSKAAGPCTLELRHQGRRAAGSLYSYDRPTAYDFELMKDGKGGWELRRK